MSVQSCGLSQHERLVVPPKEAWRMLGVSNSTGYELLAAGELDSIKFGRARRITVASIHRLIDRRLAETWRCVETHRIGRNKPKRETSEKASVAAGKTYLSPRSAPAGRLPGAGDFNDDVGF